MAPKHESQDSSESSRPTKYRMGSDGSPIAIAITNNINNLAPSRSAEVEIDTRLKKALLLVVVEGCPIEYKGESLTWTKAEELRRKDPEYRMQLIKHNNNTSLLCNTDVLRMIMKLVVIPDTPLLFEQVALRSNKFYWSNYQGSDPGLTPELEAIKLSKLCRGLYKSICHGYLLYLYAQFKMPDYTACDNLAFFPAIAPDRRDMIRHLSCPWDIYSKGDAGKMFTMLTSLKLLKTLELRLDVLAARTFKHSNNNDLTKISGFNKLALLLQVRKVKLQIVVSDPYSGFPGYLTSQYNATMAFGQEILGALKTYKIKKCNTSEAAIQARFDRLELESELDIHGSGRLGLYRKENSVSSRTRSTVRLGVDGLGRANLRTTKPEYADEILNWKHVTILKSKVLKSDHHDYVRQGCNVQFEVLHKKVTSWHNATDLCSYELRMAIVLYYQKELDKGAQGADQVILLWRTDLANRYKYKREDFPDRDDVKKEIRQQNHWAWNEGRVMMTTLIKSLKSAVSRHKIAQREKRRRIA